MVVARELAGMTALVVGHAGDEAVRVVAEALRVRGADCRVAEVGNPEAGRRFAGDFRGRHDTLHRLVLMGPNSAAHHVLAAELLPLLMAAGSPSYGPGSRIVIAGRLARFGRSWVGNLRLARGIHERLKDASLSRRVQCVTALGAESVVEAACDPELRSGECMAPAGLAGRVGAPARGWLPERAGSRAQAELFLEALDEAGRTGFGALRRRADELEARRLELASGERRISAMVRARNEEEFPRPAVESIIAAVIRDNMGTGPTLADEQRRTLERWIRPA
jgi:hypothetical protein